MVDYSNVIDAEYKKALSDDNMGAHLPRLAELASRCRKVTEFGTRNGISTIGLLKGCSNVTTYDIELTERSDLLKCLGIDVRIEDVWNSACVIEPTDMLFTDTVHDYRYLKRELALHASKVRRFIAVHDTEAAAEFGHNWTGGLKYAIEEFLWEGTFKQISHSMGCCGMTVLERV